MTHGSIFVVTLGTQIQAIYEGIDTGTTKICTPETPVSGNEGCTKKSVQGTNTDDEEDSSTDREGNEEGSSQCPFIYSLTNFERC